MAYIENGDQSLRIDYYDAPILNDPTLSAGGNLLPNTTYYYKVVACSYNYINLIIAPMFLGAWSNTKSITTTSTNRTINLSWSNVNASYYFIFRSLTGNFDDAEDFIPSNHSSYIKQDITGTSYDDDGSFSYFYRWLIRPNGVPLLSIQSGSKNIGDLYNFIISCPPPLNSFVDLYWIVPQSETTIPQFTGYYQPLIYRLDFNLRISPGAIFTIVDIQLVLRGQFWLDSGGTFQSGIKSASGMTSNGSIFCHAISFFGWYARGIFKFYDSIFWDLGSIKTPQPSTSGYEKYTQPSYRAMLHYDPGEIIDSQFKHAWRVYFVPTEASGGGVLLKNFKLEYGEYEQYYNRVTVNKLIVEGRSYGVWVYYDEAKIYNLETYDCSYDIGVSMQSESGQDNYLELVNPIFRANGQANTLDGFIYMNPSPQDKWMRIYLELDITVVTNAGDVSIPVQNALVRITTNDGIIYEDYTNSDGKIDTIEVREGKYIFNPQGGVRVGYISDLVNAGYLIKEEGNPIKIEIIKSGFVAYNRLIEIKEKSKWIIGINQVVPGITEDISIDVDEEIIEANIIEDIVDINIED